MKNFTVTFLVSVLIFGLIAFLIIGSALGALRANPDPDLNPGEDTGGDDPGSTPSGSDISQTGGTSFTALLVGVDYQPTVFNDYIVGAGSQIGFSPESNSEYSLFHSRIPSADTIVVLRIDKQNERIMLSSLSRDTVISINGGEMALGSLLYYGGIDYLCEAVTSLCGLPIDYYAMIDYAGLAEIVDQIGGVEFNVPFEMNYEDPAEGLKIKISSGVQKLNGETAVKMLRYHSYPDGNVYRMRVGVEFLKSLLQTAAASIRPADAAQLYSTLKSCVKTNFTTADFLQNMDMFFLYENFQKTVITYPGTISEKDGIKRFEPNVSAALELYRGYKFAG